MQKGYVIKHSQKKRLLETFTDMKLNVQCQTENLRTQVSWKLGALERVLLYQELSKRKILVNTYFSSQFNYCSLIWIFHISCLFKLSFVFSVDFDQCIIYFSITHCGKSCPYLEFFWSVFSPNAGKYGSEKFRIQTLFTQ